MVQEERWRKGIHCSVRIWDALFYLRKSKSLLAKSGGNKGNKALDQLTESEEDDGDYATLREIPSDTMSEENKVLSSVFYPYLYDHKLYLLPCYSPLTVLVLFSNYMSTDH